MLKSYQGKGPEVHETSFIAETANLVGDVTIRENANIWYNTVLRGDDNYIYVGKNTNVQDNCVVHVSHVHPTVIGENVTIGHSAIIHACKIGNYCLVGMGSIVLNGVEIGEYTIIGAGSLVPKGKVIPSGVLVMGSPAKIIRELTADEKKMLEDSATDYVELAKKYQEI